MAQKNFLLKDSAPSDVFTDVFLKWLIHDSDDNRFGLVKRWMKTGDIVRLKRGVYALGHRNKIMGVNPYQIAQILYGPSYVSLESALSYHGWIPEAVYAVTSVTPKRAVEMKTPLGVFSYAPVHFKTFFAGVDRIESENGAFLMASPWRAMADYVYVHRKNWKGLEPVVESLRVAPEFFTDLRTLDEVVESATNRRTRTFLEHCKKGLP
jgi:predicted transcriptional regulator of viral defense system